MVDINSINKPENRRKKRILDLILALAFIPLVPVSPLLGLRFSSFFNNWLQVLLGNKTWVGVPTKTGIKSRKLALLHPADGLSEPISDETTKQRLGFLYNRDYKALNDLQIIFRGFRKLG